MLIGQKPLVIYFTQRQYTDVPRKRAVFAINTKISKIWVVIGISSDTVESHQKFTKQTKFYYITMKIRRLLVFHQECLEESSQIEKHVCEV
jgi:peroxiredoxin